VKVNLFHTKVDNTKDLNSLKKSFEALLESGQFVLGNNVKVFESNLSKYLKAKYAVGVNSGTDALTLSLVAMGIKPGDFVITSSFTYFATIEAIHNIGAKPFLVDICEDTLQINLENIKPEILKKAKAIIPVHLFGGHVDIEKLLKIKKLYNLKIVEDVAQAFGTKVNNSYAGTFGDCGAFSFYPTKTLGSIGDAGAVVTDSKHIFENLMKLRNHGHIDRDNFKFSGYNSRLDEIQAIFLNKKLENIDIEIAKRQTIAGKYQKNLSDIKNISFFNHNNKTFNYFPILCKNKKERKDLINFLNSKNIQTAIYYKKALSDLSFDWIYRDSDLHHVNNIKNRILCLPIYPELNRSKLDYVISNIRNFYES